MQNLITHSSRLEQELLALHTDNSQSKKWFYDTVVAILDNQNISFYSKSDRIAEAFVSLDSKIDYLKEQQKLLASLKKQLEIAKTNGKEQVAKALLSFGIDKLEGLAISSITVSDATDETSTKLEILDEKALIHAGYFSVILDTKAVENALISADQRHEVEEFADMNIVSVHKPASIRINKRKLLSTEQPQIQAA